MSTITRSYRIRAYPNGAQRRLLDRWFGATRWLWNTALGIRSEAYRECGLRLTGNDLSRWLTSWKRTAGHEWLAEAPATCLTQCLRDQDAAFRNFFAGRTQYPRFKRKNTCGSVRFQDVGPAWVRGRVSLPKLGALKLAESLPKVERPDSMTLARDALGRYHVSFSAQVEAALLPIMQRSVGVDVGLTHLATLSTGEKIPNPKRYHALTYKSDWYGKVLVAVDRWYPSSKRCSECQYTLDELRLDERQWQCPGCGTWHDRDVNAARNLLTEGLHQLAGRDDRDLRVDAGDACPEEILVQVLAEEARSGQRNRACLEQARFS